MSMPKLRCISYNDSYSVDNSSYNDLVISFDKNVVGCNGTNCSKLDTGDYVIITGKKKKTKYYCIGIIISPLDYCYEWMLRGGRNWDHNYTFKPVTPIFEITEELKHTLKTVYNADPMHLFNMRFCTEKKYFSTIISLMMHNKLKQ